MSNTESRKMMNITGWWLTYPSEKWWSSSVGIMKFPTEWKVIKFHGSKPPTSINISRLCKTHGDHQRWPRNDIAIMSRKLVPPASAFQRTPRISSNLLSKQLGWTKGCRIVFVFFLPQVFFWYLLPCICNSFELEPVILHGICYILAWSIKVSLGFHL